MRSLAVIVAFSCLSSACQAKDDSASAALVDETAPADMVEGGFDFENLEHTEWASTQFANLYETKDETLIEFCVAFSRLAIGEMNGKHDKFAWSLTNFYNLAWEKELEQSYQSNDNLKTIFNARRRVDWPKHLLTYEAHEELLSSKNVERCGGPVNATLEALAMEK